MYPVIEHLNNRKNKSVPVNDGRKIALVLFGGMMTGVRGTGALIALQELGLIDAFDEIYTISVGFVNGSYFLAKQVQLGASLSYEDLCSKKFINFFRFWKLVDVGYVVRVIKEVKKLDVKTLLTSKTKLFAKLLNVKTKKHEYINIEDFDEQTYFSILKAATSIPYLNPGSVKIGDNYYMDSDLSHKELVEHLNYVLNSNATDILVVYSHYGQFKTIRKAGIQGSEKFYEIIPDKNEKLSRFCTDPVAMKIAARMAGLKVKNLFGENTEINLNYENRD